MPAMNLYVLFSLISAGFVGATVGSLLLTSLLYQALLKSTSTLNNQIYIYRRLYRLNSVLCLLAGVCAALVNNQPAALMLTILAVSYVFNHAHILKGLQKACNEQLEPVNSRAYQSMSSLQNLMHILQLAGAGYAIYLLANI